MNFLGLQIQTRASDPAAYNESLWTGDVRWSELPNFFSTIASPEAAMKSSAVYSCVRLIAESIGSLPLIIYRKLKGGGKEHAIDHPLYLTLNMFPNQRNTRMEFVEMFVWHMLLRGNAYLKINMTPQGDISLDALNPDFMQVTVLKDNSLQYAFSQPGAVTKLFNDSQISQIRLHSLDGVRGRSPIQVARETVFRAVTLEEFHGSTYRNGVKPSGVLEHPKTLTKESSDRITKSFREAYAGQMNAGKVPLLEEGMKFTPFTMSLEDAEFIAGRKLTRAEIAGIFGVPPHMIGDLERATFSNIENQATQFVVHCLRPYLVRIEQALQRDLLADFEQRDFHIEFNADAFLRGDTIARFQSYQLGLQNGLLRINEARDKENLNPLPWGDATMIPLNMKVIRDEADLEQEPAAPTADPGTLDDSQNVDGVGDGGDTQTNSARAVIKLLYSETSRPWINTLLTESINRDDESASPRIDRAVEFHASEFWKHYQTARAIDGLSVQPFTRSFHALELIKMNIKHHVRGKHDTEAHVHWLADEFVGVLTHVSDLEEMTDGTKATN